MKTRFKLLCKIFLTFLKISPLTFGGGYAMLSQIELEVVKKNNWLNEKEIIDVFTVSQTIPGAVAINSAILIGYRIAKLAGAMFALIGIILPTLFLITLFYYSYYSFYDNQFVKAAFTGIGAGVIALIIHSGYIVGRTAIKDKTTLFITITSILLLLILQVNPIFLIIGALIVGLFIIRVKEIRKEIVKSRPK